MKRRLVALFVFLLLGAIINVAVAWGFALWGGFRPYMNESYTHDSKPRWTVAMGYGFGLTRVVHACDNGMWAESGRYKLNPTATPYWSCTRDRPDHETFTDPARPWRIEIGFGWPLRSTRAELWHYQSQHLGQSHPVGVFYSHSGIPVRTSSASSLVPYRVLPVQVIWPGFAINTLFYAAVLWLLFAAPFVLRRRRRIRRGLCPKCAYPVGTNTVCTECGAPRAVTPPPPPPPPPKEIAA